MENKTLQVFNNPEFGKVRVVTIDKEPWFVGKDVAVALGYESPRAAISKKVDDEDKGVSKMETPSGEQVMTIINESGLYSLILSSKLPTAKKFKHWVTSEVLPDIRKHGAYMTLQKIEEALLNPDVLIRLATDLKKEKQEKERLQAELDYSKEWYSIKRVAKINDISWKSISWRKLKQASTDLGIGVKKIFDANYGEVNTYHVKAWEIAYPELEL